LSHDSMFSVHSDYSYRGQYTIFPSDCQPEDVTTFCILWLSLFRAFSRSFLFLIPTLSMPKESIVSLSKITWTFHLIYSLKFGFLQDFCRTKVYIIFQLKIDTNSYPHFPHGFPQMFFLYCRINFFYFFNLHQIRKRIFLFFQVSL